MNKAVFLLAAPLLSLLCGCGAGPSGFTEIRHYPIFSLDDVVAKDEVALDDKITQDRNGSIRITAEKEKSLVLFEESALADQNCTLLCQAWMRTEKVEGGAWLLLSYGVEGKAEVIQKMPVPLSGSSEWTKEEISIDLPAGAKPGMLRIGIVTGKGMVWVDELRLYKKAD